MGASYARLIFGAVILFQFSTTVSAGPLDDHYLQQFGETSNTQLQKAILSVTPEAGESARCGMPLKHGLKRDWNLLEQPTRKALAKQLAAPVLVSPAIYTSSGGHFTVHYAVTGPDAPPLTDVSGITGVPDWVETVAATFENVYGSYGALGYRPAPTAAGAPYDVYLLDLAPQRFYGTTNSDKPASSAGFPNAFTSWMEIDNNFTDGIYKPNLYSPLQSLQITAAHEYHHAVQYGYNFFFDVWYAEATSTWMEDELYDNVNQLYTYITDWFSNSSLSLDSFINPDSLNQNLPLGYGYGRWIFNRYLAEKHTPAMIRGVWEAVAEIPSPGGDIPMAPVLDSVLSSATYGSSLSTDFFGFTKRVYIGGWTTHKSEIATSAIATKLAYSPVATYSAYPVNSVSSIPAPSITLPHYSFAYYRFTPASGVPTLTITIAKSSGIQTAVFRKSLGVITEITVNAVGNSYTDNAFSSSDEVVLLIANTTNIDGHGANFSTDGSPVAVTEPTTPPPSTSGGSSSGCFIATAAYGSYLHPQVQLLRNFRDEFLLTNDPGRVLVAFYYRCSPPLADFIAGRPVLRGAARLALTPLVAAVAHPLISAVSLLLLSGALLISLLRRIKTARSNAHRCAIRTT